MTDHRDTLRDPVRAPLCRLCGALRFCRCTQPVLSFEPVSGRTVVWERGPRR